MVMTSVDDPLGWCNFLSMSLATFRTRNVVIGSSTQTHILADLLSIVRKDTTGSHAEWACWMLLAASHVLLITCNILSLAFAFFH